jgi:hypothetical protein
MHHSRESGKFRIPYMEFCEHQIFLSGIPGNFAEFNINFDRRSEVRKENKIPAEFRTDGIPRTPYSGSSVVEIIISPYESLLCIINVLDPEKGVCTDPVGGDATLGVGGPGPPVGVSERQLSLDREGEKT